MDREDTPRSSHKTSTQEPEDLFSQGPVIVRCDSCDGSPALVYCRADTARLCLHCDRHVHVANAVSARHVRTRLCDACRAAPAAVLCSAARCCYRHAALCSNCEFEAHGHGDVCCHRCAAEGYTGCPSVADLAVVLGVSVDERSAGEGCGWEVPRVLRLEDLLVPTTSCHGFQALVGMHPMPKYQDSTREEHDEEILRQLHDLIDGRSTIDGSDSLEPIPELPPWSSLEYALELSNPVPHASQDTTSIKIPDCEDGKWNHSESHKPAEKFAVEYPYEQYLKSSPEANLSSFVEIKEICPSPSADICRVHPVAKDTTQVSLPRQVGNVLACPDRGTMISRYMEKKKTRRYDKLIRYESRKVRADSRLRINGRFAKANQVEK